MEIVSINAGPVVITLLIWINTAISLSFFLSAFFSNARNALLGTFIILLMSIFISVSAVAIWDISPPDPYFLWPPFACYTALGIINARAINLDSPALTVQTMGVDGKLKSALLYLFVEWIAFLAFAVYALVSLAFGEG